MYRKTSLLPIVSILIAAVSWFSALHSTFIPKDYIVDLQYGRGGNPTVSGDLEQAAIYTFFDLPEMNTILFVNANVYEHNNSKGIGGGLGARTAYRNDSIIGFNFYYCNQNGREALNQAGFGCELLFCGLTLSCNIYIPFGSDSFDEDEYIFDDYIDDYRVTLWTKQVVGKSFDLSVCKTCVDLGRHVQSSLTFELYGIDFYMCRKYLGGQAALRLTFFDSLYVEPRINHDQLYGTDFGVKAGISYTLSSSCDPITLAHQPVTRKPFVHLRKCYVYETNY